MTIDTQQEIDFPTDKPQIYIDEKDLDLIAKKQQNEYSLFRFDAEMVLKKIPDESIDLIITSPPYNLSKEYEKKKKITMSEYFDWQGRIISLCYKKLKPTGSICWQVGYNNKLDKNPKNHEYGPLDYEFHPIFKKNNFIMKNRIVWAFGHGANNKNNFSTRHEVIMWYTKSAEYVFNLDDIRIKQKYPGKQGSNKKSLNYQKITSEKGGKNPEDVWFEEMQSNFWQIPNVKSHHPEKYMQEIEKKGETLSIPVHPCQFPVALASRLVIGLSKIEATVLDPFCGLGTVGVSCALTNRKFIGIDIDEEGKYLEKAKERIEEASVNNLTHIRDDKPVADHKKSYLWKDFDWDKWELKNKKK